MRGSGIWHDPYILEDMNDLSTDVLSNLIQLSDKIYVVQGFAIDGTDYYENTGDVFELPLGVLRNTVYDGYYHKNKNIRVDAIRKGCELRNFYTKIDRFVDKLRYPFGLTRYVINGGICDSLEGKLVNCHIQLDYNGVEVYGSVGGNRVITGLVTTFGSTSAGDKSVVEIIGCTANINVNMVIKPDDILGRGGGYVDVCGVTSGDIINSTNIKRVVNTLVKANVQITHDGSRNVFGKSTFMGIGNVDEIIGCCVYANYSGGDNFYGLSRSSSYVKASYVIADAEIDRHIYNEQYENTNYHTSLCGLLEQIRTNSVPRFGVSDCYVKLRYDAPYDYYVYVGNYTKNNTYDYYWSIIDGNGTLLLDCRGNPYTQNLYIKTPKMGGVVSVYAVLKENGIIVNTVKLTPQFIAHPFSTRDYLDINDKCYYSKDDTNLLYDELPIDCAVTDEDLINTTFNVADAVTLVVNSYDENGYGYGYINKQVRDENDTLAKYGTIVIKTGWDFDDYAYVRCYQQEIYLNGGFPSLTRVKYREVFGSEQIDIKEFTVKIDIGGGFICGLHVGEESGQVGDNELNYGLKACDNDYNVRTLW